MNKLLPGTLLFLLFCSTSFSQKITPDDFKSLQKKEDSLKPFALQILQGINSTDRFTADSIFTRIFVRALKVPNSFNYPFDSLTSISKLVAPDSSFKIFTWQLVVNENVVRQHGAIQKNTKDGSLNLLPLIDKSDVINNLADTVANNLNWIGAIYYRMIEKQAFGKNYYTLLGYDENNLRSNKKIVEVLTFKNGEPIFGGSYFSFADKANPNSSGSRLILEYKKNASPRLVYDEDQDMIVYEHLISETGENQKKYTYIPDGDYEGLQWKDGKWAHIEKIFTQQLKEGEAPVPNPVLDKEGNIDETKLKDNLPVQEIETEPTSQKTPVKSKKATRVKTQNN